MLGTILTLALYDFRWQSFHQSGLFTKILTWGPIFAAFVAVLYLSPPLQLLVLAVVLVLSVGEVISASHERKTLTAVSWYILAFTIALAHFGLIGTTHTSGLIALLITIGFGSALSDVGAFFCGRYWGFHKFPRIINEQKSWEGFCGQVLGALVGVLTINALVCPVPTIWLFVPIGVGSGLGDVLNSVAKRKVDIDRWSHLIPGHGGLTDRLSSLAGSAFLTFYFLALKH